MTSLEPTSRWAILPSGETFDLVRPGMSSVVGRRRGVEMADLMAGEEVHWKRRGGSIDILSWAAGVGWQRGVAQGVADAVFGNAQAILLLGRRGKRRRRLHGAMECSAVFELLHAPGRGRRGQSRRRQNRAWRGAAAERLGLGVFGDWDGGVLHVHESVSREDGVCAEAAAASREMC